MTCNCESIHKVKFTNLKMVCTNCGLVFDYQLEKPWFIQQEINKAYPPQNYPMIEKHKSEYDSLLKILNKKNLYHNNRIKVEELFTIVFGNNRKPNTNSYNEFLLAMRDF